MVSKLEVSELNSGSINEILSVCLIQRASGGNGNTWRSQGPTAWMWTSANFVSITVYLGK